MLVCFVGRCLFSLLCSFCMFSLLLFALSSVYVVSVLSAYSLLVGLVRFACVWDYFACLLSVSALFVLFPLSDVCVFLLLCLSSELFVLYVCVNCVCFCLICLLCLVCLFSLPRLFLSVS